MMLWIQGQVGGGSSRTMTKQPRSGPLWNLTPHTHLPEPSGTGCRCRAPALPPAPLLPLQALSHAAMAPHHSLCGPRPSSWPLLGPLLEQCPPPGEEHEGAGSHQLRQRNWKNLSRGPTPPAHSAGRGAPGPRACLSSGTCPTRTTSPQPTRRALGPNLQPSPPSVSEPDVLAEAVRS